MRKTIGVLALAAALGASTAAIAQEPVKPTIVLVHGAFAESAGWDGVITQLAKKGYQTIAAPNPLRSVAIDAAAVSAVVKSIPGDVVLVGHSFGGFAITEAAKDNDNVKALVYVAGFIPDAGETAIALSGKFPGSTLGDTLQKVALPDGGTDLYIQPAKFRAQFAADVPEVLTTVLAATQRPVTEAALTEGATTPTWKTLPSFAIWGELDKNIPAQALRYMADRAGALDVVEIKGASHVVMISHPVEVAAMIEAAATTVTMDVAAAE